MENAAKQNLTSPYAFRVHGAAYLGVNAALFILDWAIGGAWWFHFTALIWGFVLVIHFLVMKTFSVDENWADERSAKLRHGSYDVGHII
ncbi:MAG: 2TM domain-containing protein, partial [Rhodospirillaceae bacterium]|nr:2TM domain-containing protein [Rhodospirillaceae bacterium]